MKYRKRQRGFLFLAWLFIVVSLLSSAGQSVQAQQTVTSATVSGRVLDVRGAAVSGASLTATNVETNQKQLATTDADGRYRFPYLQVGSYTFTVEAQGFTPLSKQITVTVGQALDF
ncbi:MAG TPA: carboxypeptidase-like regulatory domain-containing protein, partial [Pyrinomonadaceae bacterium]|nr:carboxypeptidase-like regulatory domain-containing protein [Pyrinomonadaceae bacterium]